MRRVFALLLLLAPFVASCSDAPMPVAPAGAVLSEGTVPTEAEWLTDENWFTPGDVLTLADEELSVQSADAPKPKVMVFGNPDAGTNYPPGSHDQSLHGKDRINPGAIVIDAGETLAFQVNPGHRVAIYNEGVKPEDIQPNPGYYLFYPVNRLFLQPTPAPQFALKFVRPGKYLVICAVNPHFFGANMWGWVIVK